MKRKIVISKQTYLLGLRCLKGMYLKYHHPELMNSGGENSNEAAQAAGLEFEASAMELAFPGGVDVTHGTNAHSFDTYIEKTKALLQRRKATIYQATFQSKSGERIMADAVVKSGKKIELIEVKAVTLLQDIHYFDVAYQLYVIEQSGFKISKVHLVHVNKEYVRKECLSAELIVKVDVTKKVRQIQAKVALRLAGMRKTLQQKESPEATIGFHCTEPYVCPLKGFCHGQQLPKNNIFDVKGLRLKEKINYFYGGIISFEEAKKANIRLNQAQQLQIDCEINQETIFEKDKIYSWLQQFNGSTGMYYLDFETVCYATPQYTGSKIYEHVPFQFSLHYQDVAGQLHHHEFLADPTSNKDQRLVLLERLVHVLDLYGKHQPIIAFNSRFESGRLNYLASAFPQYQKEIRAIQRRLFDLADVFRNKWYYSPLFKGSYSIKYILPVLCNELSYDNLEVKNGGHASVVYMTLKNNPLPEVQRQHLLEYCKLDTLAMVKIMEKLQRMIYNN